MTNEPGLRQRLMKIVPLRIFLEALHAYDRHHCLYMAAAISFYAMISLAPLIYIALFALQRFIGSSEQAQSQLLATLQGFMLPDAASAMVTRVAGVGLLGSFGSFETWWALLALLWAGLSFYDVLTAIFTVAWGGATRRQFMARKLRALLAFIGAGVFFVLTMTLTGSIAVIEGWGNHYLGLDLDPLWLGVGWLLPYVLTIGLLFLLYKFLPNANVNWQLALCIAVPVGILWEVSKRLFVLLGGGYNHDFYGPLAWFVLLMVWIYWSSTIVLFGAEIGAAWQRYDEGFITETG
jgi:membrane protein